MAEEGTARDNIRVLVRIRPRNAKEKNTKEARPIVKALDLQTLKFDQKEDTEDFFFHGVKQRDLSFIRKRNKDLTFGFDYVFSPLQSNMEIFENALRSIVGHVIFGYNCSVFAYGATGSGKTYTMLGSSENPGLTFLMAKELSRKIKEMANEYESEIAVSYLEIYNETLTDLLSPSGILSIREDGFNGVNIPNLSKHKIQDTSDLLSMLSQGNSVRTQHPTDHNAESSRSHAVFQVRSIFRLSQ
jgi:kinesin family protein 18/19